MEKAMKGISVILLVAFALAVAGPAAAQKWPDKPVRLVVPYPPGGNVDTAARIVAPGLQEIFGQPFIVENRAGAGGMIAGEAVAKSAPDGYTLFFTANGPLLFSPLIFGRTPYRWDKDFVPVSSVSFTSLALVVHPSVPAKTLKDLIDAAKKDPGKLLVATPGAGTTNHLVSELLQTLSGASWTTVHYKGNAPATTDLIAGQVQFNFDQVSVATPYIKQGRVRALAVTSEKRVPSLPDVPTFAEAGYPAMEAATFTGVLAPAGTPKDIITRMHAALEKVLQDNNVRQRFDGIGADARASSPEAFGSYLKKEYDKWAPVIIKAKINAD
jgi:tripartite-type tricarboxylate transporter receptor subunit TctC